MCGFVAIVNTNFENNFINNKISKLSKINSHRGPDQIKFIIKKKYSLLFRRLKIIDLKERSNQPFTSEDGKIDLVFNGEIYNYLELRKELSNFNIKFRTKSDTEVVLKCYQKWGTNFVKKLRGMFSIIIFDNKKKRFVCYRDRLGQKPLFFSSFNQGLILSSEIKDIIFFKKKLSENLNTVSKYLLRGWCDDSHDTFFKDIYSFPPGNIGILKKNKIICKKYWDLKINEKKTFDAEEFNQIFSDNLKIHLRSDVPLAFTLSGGLDSSSILKKSLKFHLKDYKAYSFLSNDQSENDEKKYIKDFIKENSINHSFVSNKSYFSKNILEEINYFQDEPFSSISFLNQFILRKKIAKDGFKVLLVGEGGDEVLGGYNRMFIPYLNEVYVKKKKEIPDQIKENLIKKTGLKLRDILNKISQFNKIHLQKNDIEDQSIFKIFNYKPSQIPENIRFYNKTNLNKNNSFKSFLVNHIFKRDLPHILRQEDRISMSQSIENRSPFVDHKLLEYIFSIDTEFFMKNGNSKFMLRSILKNDLPRSYFEKKKYGRPGNPLNLISEIYFEKFIDYLSSNFAHNKFFDKDKIKRKIIYDRKNKISTNFNSYFRILNYLIWKKNISI